MERANAPIAAEVSGSGGAAAAGMTPRASADGSRCERRLTEALQRGDILSATPSALDSSSLAGGPGEVEGFVLLRSASDLPSADAAVTLLHSSGSDQATSGGRKESAGYPSDGSAAAVQQRTIRAKENEIAHLRRTVQELSSQLHNALTTLDQRADRTVELEALKSEYEVEAEQHEKGIRHARLEMLESRVRYRSMEEQLATTYEADVHARATELLEPHTKEVHAKNFGLLKEKMILAQEVITLRAEYNELQEKYVRLRRETDLDGSATRQMLQRSVSQKNEITSLRQQVKTTEDTLNTAVAEYEKKLCAEGKAHQVAIESLTRERDAARRDALRLQRELAQLRSTAGNVLAQRTELEAFFHAALEEVHQGVIEEHRQQLLENTPTARVTNAKNFLPAHTNSSLLRLERPERLLLTNGASPGLSTSSSLAYWTLDRKGFPKRIAAAPQANMLPASGVSAASLTSLAQRDTAPSNAPASPYGESAKASGTLVALPHATPLYLLSSGHQVPHLTSLASSRYAVVSTSAEQSGRECTASGGRTPFRLGTKSEEKSSCPLSSASPQQCGELNVAATDDLPLLQNLPSAPTWRDVKRVDVSELRWVDKERVIQLLLKRIRQEGRRNAAMSQRAAQESGSSATTADAVAPREEWLSSAADIGGDSLTFLTQR
ncbi:hypothetical protein JIQ42_00651 [Leishmania sp. Namibia]|uniref:hypothetical protein n=1 Tax=Leishmania sp. Namibia TaxID=2802991 RepID=UPI001B7248A6|nr:hypothetical protein JIQ42_00651 [Leishmania sp. Namibia]